ncbi:UNVERIFIED_ORG: Mg/Co/Ni transporter MgtE [Arthrobacter sp. UYCu721]
MDWLSHISQINWLAVLLAFISSMAIGFVWYMPAVLGKRWMAAIGKTEEDLKNIGGGAGIWVPMTVAAALTAVLLAVLISKLGLDSAVAGGWFAVVLALVFRAGAHVIHNGFAGRPTSVTLIDSGHDLLAMTVAGAIIGAMS